MSSMLKKKKKIQFIFQTDPFNTVHLLSKEEKETARDQRVPSLLELLQLAKNHSISVIFDLYSSGVNDVERTLKIIFSSGIDHHLVSSVMWIVAKMFQSKTFFCFVCFLQIYWLPPNNRSYVKRGAPGFVQIYNNENEMTDEGGHHLNMKYNNLSTEKIRYGRRTVIKCIQMSCTVLLPQGTHTGAVIISMLSVPRHKAASSFRHVRSSFRERRFK